MTDAETVDRIVWLERLAKRCRVHGYVDQAEQLRAHADRLNQHVDLSLRVAHDDPRTEEPIATSTVGEFIRLCQRELNLLDQAEAVAGIERGLSSMREGWGLPVHEAFESIRASADGTSDEIGQPGDQLAAISSAKKRSCPGKTSESRQTPSRCPASETPRSVLRAQSDDAG